MTIIITSAGSKNVYIFILLPNKTITSNVKYYIVKQDSSNLRAQGRGRHCFAKL